MSRERVIKALTHFGLSRFDANVYLYLSKMGPKSKAEIAEALKIKPKDLNSCVKNLWIKGIVAVSLGDPIIICAFPFETVLEILILKEIEATKSIHEERNELFF